MSIEFKCANCGNKVNLAITPQEERGRLELFCCNECNSNYKSTKLSESILYTDKIDSIEKYEEFKEEILGFPFYEKQSDDLIKEKEYLLKYGTQKPRFCLCCNVLLSDKGSDFCGDNCEIEYGERRKHELV